MTPTDDRSKAAEIQAAEQALSQDEERLGKDDKAVCDKLFELSGLYHRDGLLAKAELLLRRAVDILSKSGSKAEQLNALSILGMLYRDEGKLDDAESVYLRAVAQAEQIDNSKGLKGRRLACLAGLYAKKQQTAQAEELLKKAAEAYQADFGQQSVSARLCNMALAVVLRQVGKTAESDACFEKSRTQASSGGEIYTESRQDQSLLELVQSYYAEGRLTEANQLLEGALYTDELALWPNHPQAGQIWQVRGNLFRAQGRLLDAESCFKQALSIRQAALSIAHPEIAESAMNLATMYLSQEKLALAEAMLKIALTTRVRAFGVESPAVAACIETYAIVLKRTKRGAIATKLEARARDIRTRLVWKLDRQASSTPA